MKRTWMLLLFVLSAARAQAMDPHNFCDIGCSPRQQEIWQAFQAHQLDLPVDLSPQVYSGECYHTAPDTDSQRVQYGVGYFGPALGAVVDPKTDPAIYFSGLFAFFYDSDPYVDYTPTSAPKFFPNHGKRPASLIYKDGLNGVIDYSTHDTPWLYWLRPSADLKTLYVVAQWGIKHTVFCEWKRHDGE